MPTNPRSLGRTAAVAAVTTAALAFGLTGCGASYPVQSPAKVRTAAFKSADDGKGGGTLPAGAVDCRTAKCIALTFDSAPSDHTAQLLEILKRKKAHATFFLLGENHVEKYPELVRQMVAEGHVVANHTWTHPRLTDLKPEQIRAELVHLSTEVERLTGRKMTLMRPPQGRTDEKVTKVCKELGLAQVLWSDTAKDYTTTDSALIRKRIVDGASRDGIILLHDLYDGTVPAVPGIIDTLRAQGYTFVTVPELLAPAVPEPGQVYRP